MKRSAEIGWVSHADATAWDGINELRNTLVHRNGICDKDAKYQITKTWGLQFAKGHSITTQLNLYPDLAAWLIDNYAKWTNSCLLHLGTTGFNSLLDA